SLQTQKSGPYLFVSFIRNAVLSSHCRYFTQRGLFLPVVGADKEKGRISGPFRESDASMRNFRDFF
ncbi:hypothetical protein RCP77_24030, partial [Enterobacter kobei]|uniref:hypothetical protein n=1 Tax=Enterobacter kobei TaxID=208224 RepID=UPI002A75CDEA